MSAMDPIWRLGWLVLYCNALLMTAPAHAQGLVWGQFNGAPAFGAGSTAPSQTHIATVAGIGPGSGSVALQLSVSGGSNAWNGFGIARDDDGYFSAPDLPLPGITFINGGPAFLGGIPLLAPIGFATGYRLDGAPAATPAPISDRSALYFDAADGVTAHVRWDFSGLLGSVLPTGSWVFLDDVDQGERLLLSGPSGWIAAVHVGDSSLPRPPSPIPLPVMVSAPDFPACTPAMSQTATTLQLDGRYGDISAALPTCSNVPVPVPGQTVGYTKGADSVAIWIRTARELSMLELSAIDSDPSTSNGSGGYTGPDNNFFIGLGFMALTRGPLAIALPAIGGVALVGLGLLLVLLATRALRDPRS